MRYCFLAILWVLTCVRVSAAQSEAPPEHYRDLIEEALTESRAGRWDEARALFQLAHRLYPNARTLRGIGMASFELRDYRAAYRALTNALDEPARPLTEEQRVEVLSLVTRTRARLGRYSLAQLPEDAEVLIDGALARIEPDHVLLLDLGHHRVEVRSAEGHAQADLMVRGGEDGPLPMVIEPPTPNARPPVVLRDTSPIPPLPHVPQLQRSAAETPPRAGAWVALGAGIAVIGGGGALITLGHRDIRLVEQATAGTTWSEIRDAYDRTPRRSGWGYTLVGLGAASTGVGIFLLLTRRDRDDGSVRAQVGPTGASLQAMW